MHPARSAPWPHRWRWFIGLYAAGVGTLAAVAYGLRALLRALV